MTHSWKKAQTLETVRRAPLTRDDLFHYAEGSGDRNPIHLDESFAKEQGFPSVIAHGMLSMGYLSDYVLSHFGEDTYRLTRFKTRFRKITLPGDELTLGGTIKEVTPEKILVSLWIRNQRDEVTTEGEADLCMK